MASSSIPDFGDVDWPPAMIEAHARDVLGVHLPSRRGGGAGFDRRRGPVDLWRSRRCSLCDVTFPCRYVRWALRHR